MKYPITLTVNGERRELSVAPHRTLLDVLRNDLELRGTNRGCDSGDCGACTVLMTRPGAESRKAVTSCMILAVDADGAEITTIEGLAQSGQRHPRRLHPLQQAFVEHGAVQCGFCTPGMILTAVAFLEENPHPTEAEVRAGLAGNLCRCTGYAKIVEAVLAAAAHHIPDP
jgi:carbon-monoxide dehydrogenase small subunit